MKATHTTEEISYQHYGCKSYRIETDRSGVRYYQRHIWTMQDGTVQFEAWLEAPKIEAKPAHV